MQPAEDVESTLVLPAAASARVGRGALLVMAFLGIILPLAVVEIALRLYGFSYRLYPEKMEFGFPDFKTMETSYIQDPDLFWTPKDYPQRLQTLIAKSPQIVFMGDSCTEFGTYDVELAKLVQSSHPDLAVSMDKIGVAGWASYQGRRQMERDVTRIKPKIATIYYGWNDHWIGFGVEDKDVVNLHTSLWAQVQRLRIVQLAIKAYLSLGHKDGRLPQRVSVADYHANLKSMVETAKAHGVTPVLITAPTSQERGKEPAYLKGRFLNDLSDLIPLHQAYLAEVRAVAAEEHVPLCDLYNDFAALPHRDVVLRYFKSSGIHLTPEGNKLIGKFLYDCFEREKLFDLLKGA
jgi:lysophospholipase L1-like esterase